MQTRKGEPWRPWTWPNLIGYIRLALVPTFLVLALQSGDGRDTLATTIAIVAGTTDYLDGLVARLTGQFSRVGALLDPLVDRLLILSCVIVTYHFELLPRAALLLLAARELLMLVLSLFALRAGVEIKINWAGRLAVWPIMGGLFLALIVQTWVAAALLWIGTAGAWYSTYLYVRALLPVVRGATAHDLNQ